VRKKRVPRHDDLFQIFPDLPQARPRTREERLLRLRQQMIATRERAAKRIAEQREAVERVRARVATRQPRHNDLALRRRRLRRA
jgi:hypothetical protein